MEAEKEATEGSLAPIAHWVGRLKGWGLGTRLNRSALNCDGQWACWVNHYTTHPTPAPAPNARKRAHRLLI